MSLPFKYGKIVEDTHFVNRTAEIKSVTMWVQSQINLVLISPRRWGKSSLIDKVSRVVPKQNKQIRFCFIDLFSTRNEEEFYNYFATQVIRASYGKWDEAIEKTKIFFKQLTPKFTFSPTANTEISISFDWETVQRHPQEILELPEIISKTKNIQLVICLDEFQNIAHYDDSHGFQKKLRAVWQKHQHCSYILYGSKQHMMSELFEDKKQPFYKFGEIVFLDKIDNREWAIYIQKRFKNTLKKISLKHASLLAKTVENHPYFVQQLANNVWLHTPSECTGTHIQTGLFSLLNQYDIVFSREVDGLSNLQLNLLGALAHDETQITSKDTIVRYRLSSSGSIIKARKALIQKEIIDIIKNKTVFLDPLFKIWLKEIYFKNRKL